MKDAFSQNAQRIQSSMQSLDATVAAASERMTRNLDRIQKGTMMIGAGLALMAVPAALVASTAATQKALGELASLGVQGPARHRGRRRIVHQPVVRCRQGRVHHRDL